MNDDLRNTLHELLASGSESNPAMNALLDSYARYHTVFVAVGGLFLVGFALLAASSWRRLRRTPRSARRRWSFERATYLLFTGSSAVLALMMAVLVAANLSNAVDPRPGFSGAVGMVGTSRAGTRTADLHQAFTTWLWSGRADVPALVDSRIDGRLAWQRPKAAICSVVLVVFVLLGARLWRELIRRSRAREDGWKLRDIALLAAGLMVGPICLVLTVMVIGNTQASFAPLSMTLFYG